MNSLVHRAGMVGAQNVILTGLGVLGAFFVAYGSAKGNPLLGAVPLALVCALLLSSYPQAVLWVALTTGLVAAGLAELYVPQFQAIRWLVVPLGGILLLHVLLRRLAVGIDSRHPAKGGPAPIILLSAAVVVTVALFATLVNFPEPMQLVRGVKGYFQAWGVMAGLALLPWSDDLMRRRLPQALLAIALLQLPFVLHQYVVLVPFRATIGISTPADVIAGTFGAAVTGGGNNSMLSVYMFVVAGGLVALWQKRMLSWKWLAIMGPALLAPMLVNIARVSLVYLLVLFLVLFAKDAMAKPARFLGIGVLAVLGIAVMVIAQSSQKGGSQGIEGFVGFVEEIYETNVADDHLSGGSLSRAGALRYWADKHFPGDIFRMILGHGLYESRYVSEATDVWEISDPSLGLENTAVSAILWDAGLLGLLAVFGLVLSAYVTAGRLEGRYNKDDPWMAGLFRGAKAAMVIIFVSLWVKSFFTYQIAYQTMLMVLLGWLAYWDRRSRVPK